MWSPTWPPAWSRRPDGDPELGLPASDGLIELGRGTAAARGVAPKAAVLDSARHAGLPVPIGVIVLSEADSVSVGPQLTGWLTEHGIDRCAVRSAFGGEDDATESRAGWYRTDLDVAVRDVVSSIEAVRASADDGDRTDVLVMSMVPARHAGVAFSEPGTYDDLVNAVDGLADELVSGDVEGERVLLPRLESAPLDWQNRLRRLLADVRRTFGDLPWDVEWADDGHRCWLLQIRPITAPPVRDELLTLANHAEILPELPSTLMTSVIERAGPDLFAWYRRRVPGLPADRDFLHVVAGRPMINLSLLEDMMRHLGLPTALVADSIGGGGGPDRPLAPTRVVRRTPSLLRLGLAQIGAVAAARRNERRIAAIGADGATSFGMALDQLHESYVALVTGMFPLSSAIGPPLAVLRRAGTLLDHAGAHRTITAELADGLAAVRAAPDSDRERALSRFLRRFGHRGVYESDIARPRFRDDVDAVLGSGAPAGAGAADDLGSMVTAGGPQRRSWRWWVTRPVWWTAVGPLSARERYRHEAMRSFAAIRESLTELATRAAVAGQLPNADALWLLDVDQARSLDEGVVFDEAACESARAARAELAAFDPPAVVSRFDDPASWGDDTATADGWSGLALTTGSVTGRAWVLSEPAAAIPESLLGEPVVLVARSIDAGWVTTLPLVAGVAVEIGGDLSHGSILVRELGVPAITNARGVTASITTGDAVELNAGSGTIRRRTP